MSVEALQAQCRPDEIVECILKSLIVLFWENAQGSIASWDNFFEVKHAPNSRSAKIHAKSDISIVSSPKIDSLSNEFAGDILFLESLLYDNSSPRPPEALQANSNAIESLPPSHIPVADNDSLMEEIDLFLADDGSIPPGIESDDDNSVDDDTSISLPEFESFYVDYPNSGNSTIDVVEDIPVDVPNVLPTHPILEQDFIPTSEFFAYVVWIFLPFLAYPVIPPSLLSCGDEDTIFDPGISKDCPDCEDSQFCHSSRVSHLQLQLGIRYPNLID
ncbi:hypothetical protein Tco_1532376 [Tanacetum coccineum]